jgi:hypothetical protein
MNLASIRLLQSSDAAAFFPEIGPVAAVAEAISQRRGFVMNSTRRRKARSARNHRPWQKDRARLVLESLESRQLLTLTLTVGPNLNTGHLSGNQSETSIAINPTNPNNLYAVSNTSRRVSFDAGATWSNAGTLPSGTCCDNKSVFDQYGNLFVSYLTGSVVGALAMSTNGGVSFTSLVTGVGSDYPGVAVGPDGTGFGSVWVYADNPGATIIARGAQVTGLGAVGAFTASQSVTVGQFGDIAVGKDGRVTVTGSDCTGHPSNGPCPVKVATDYNGLGGGGFSAAVTVVTSNVGTFTPIPAQMNRTIDAQPNLEYSPITGRLYMTYTDRPSTSSADTDIYETSSPDGTSWSPPLKLNDDGATGASQFFSDIAIDPTTGFIAVTWYDCRNSPGNNSAQIYGTATQFRRGGWVPNVPIATGISDADLASSSFEFGDFDTMRFYGGAFYRSWADNASPSTLSPPNTGAPTDQDMATARVDVTVTPGSGFTVWLDGPVDLSGVMAPAKPVIVQKGQAAAVHTIALPEDGLATPTKSAMMAVHPRAAKPFTATQGWSGLFNDLFAEP